ERRETTSDIARVLVEFAITPRTAILDQRKVIRCLHDIPIDNCMETARHARSDLFKINLLRNLRHGLTSHKFSTMHYRRVSQTAQTGEMSRGQTRCSGSVEHQAPIGMPPDTSGRTPRPSWACGR